MTKEPHETRITNVMLSDVIPEVRILRIFTSDNRSFVITETLLLFLINNHSRKLESGDLMMNDGLLDLLLNVRNDEKDRGMIA